MGSSWSWTNSRRCLKPVHIRISESALYNVKGMLLKERVSVSEVFRELLNQIIDDPRLLDKVVKIVKTKRAAAIIDSFVVQKDGKVLQKKRDIATLERVDSDDAELLYGMIEEEIKNEQHGRS